MLIYNGYVRNLRFYVLEGSRSIYRQENIEASDVEITHTNRILDNHDENI